MHYIATALAFIVLFISGLVFAVTRPYEQATGPDGTVVLRRWKLAKLPLGRRLYLHCLSASDSGRELHDHPWPFKTLILFGGYYEWQFEKNFAKYCVYPPRGEKLETYVQERNKRDLSSLWTIHRKVRPFTIISHAAEDAHNITLTSYPSGLPKPAWSLVLIGPKEREWGFYTEDRWVDHSDYRSYKESKNATAVGSQSA